MCFIYIYISLLKRKYEIHTKIGMIQEFTPRIPLFGMNNIPGYVLHTITEVWIPFLFKYVIYSFQVCNTYLQSMYYIPI